MFKFSAWEQGYYEALVKLGFDPAKAKAQVEAVRSAVTKGRQKAVAPLAKDVRANPHHAQGVQPHATNTHPLTGEQMPNPYHAAYQQALAQMPPAIPASARRAG
jgi:hypothetical protein